MCLIAVPIPALAEDVPYEVTVNEGFEDSTYESGLTISGGNTNAYIYCNEQNQYGTTGCSLAIQSGTYVFEFSEDVYEIGFLVGAVNNSYSVKYYYSDSTDETIQKSGQDNSNFSTMYDSFYKSFTDYNNDEANTDKFITKFEVTVSDPSLVDTLYWQYQDIPVTTTTSSTTTTTTTTTVPPTTTTSSTTTSSTTTSTTTTTTSTTTTTLPPPPTTTTTTLAPVIVEINGEEVEYTQAEVDDGTVDRDIERQANEEEWGCYVTDIALERGDCPAYNDYLKQEEEKEEVIIDIKDEEITDTKTELPNDDDVVLEVESDDEIKDIEDKVVEEIVEEEIKIDVKELEEEFKFEEEEIVIEIPEEIIIIIEEDVEEEVIEDELDEEILTDDTESEAEIQEEDELVIEEEVIEEVELTEEEIQEEVKEVEEKIEAIQETNVEELETEQVVEIIEEVNDAGLENLDEVSEDVLEVVAEVVEQSIAKADELTEEQQEVVAEVLGFTETEDVQVIAEAVKTDKTVAKAVEEYVERVVENADIEDYNLADVTTEITFESLAQGDFSVIIDVDLDAINLTNITDDMSSQQKEKAQEVIVPTIMVRILSLAVRRFN